MIWKTGLLSGSALGMCLAMTSAAAAQPNDPLAPTTVEQVIRDNQLTNGDFETDADADGIPDGWSVSDNGLPVFKLDNTAAHHGQQSWAIAGGGRDVNARSPVVPIVGEHAYTITLSVRQEGLPEALEGVGVSIWWQGPEGRSRQVLGRVRGEQEWTQHTYVVLAPPQTRSATLTLSSASDHDGTVWFDQLAIAPGVVARPEADLTTTDYARQCLTFEYMGKEFERFLVFRAPYLSDALQRRAAALAERMTQHAQQARAAAPDPAALDACLQEEPRRTLYFEETVYNGVLAFEPSPAEPWYARWRELADQREQFEAAAAAELAETRPRTIREEVRRVLGPKATYGISVASSLQKILRDEPLLSPIATEAHLALAGHEHEGVQIILIPLEQPLEQVRVTVSPLTSDDGAVLDAAHVQWQPVGYVQTDRPDYHVSYVGWWPDPLLPTGPFDVPLGQNQPIWLNVYAPADQPAGVYRGTVTIAPANAEPVEVALAVRVWGFSLPARGQFKVLDRFNLGILNQYYGWKTTPPETLRQWYDFLLAHRFPGTEIYTTRMQPTGAQLKASLDRGLNALNLSNVSFFVRTPPALYHAPSTEEAQTIIDTVRAHAQQLAEHGGEGAGYVYAFDEVHDRSLYPAIRQVAELVHSAAPGVKFATTTTYSPIDELIGAVDTWIPLLGKYTDELEERRQAGDEIFFYIYGHPLHPFPNAATIDYPAIDGRISFWIASNMGWSGFLHWLSNGWRANLPEDQDGPRWPSVAWKPYSSDNYKGRRNGEGYFIYPGPDGQPLSSIRFEAMRDGIEDWEMLAMLRQLRQQAAQRSGADELVAQADAALAQAQALAPLDYEFNPHPTALLDARRAVGEALEALTAAQP